MPFFSIRPTGIFNLRSRRRLPFLLRQILTTGYVAGGYKDTVTWRNVNSINNATDTSTNHGDLLQAGGSYMVGMWNRNNVFITGTNGTGTQGWGAFSNTSCFNMRTNTTLAKTAAMDGLAPVSHSQALMETDGDGGYVYGYYTGGNNGSNIIRRFNMITEITDAGYGQSTPYPNISNDTGEGSSGLMDETYGVWYNNSVQRRFTFATLADAAYAVSPASSSQQRGMSTKLGVGWAGNEGSYSGGYNLRKTNLVTQSTVGTYGKPVGNSGEENMTMGQAHQYMLGMYNGAQNNASWRWNYATDSGFQGGASMEPTGSGIAGRSSGVCSWRD